MKLLNLLACLVCFLSFPYSLNLPQSFAMEAGSTAYTEANATSSGTDMMHLRWKDLGEGVEYQFQMARDKEFHQIILDQRCDRPEISFSRPDVSGTYYVRIRPVAADGMEGNFFQEQSFKISRKLQPPIITSPAGLSEFRDIFDIKVAWTGVPNAAGYHIILARDRLFKYIILDNSNFTGTSLWIRKLDYGTYFTKISAVSKEGVEGPFSDILYFVIVPHPMTETSGR